MFFLRTLVGRVISLAVVALVLGVGAWFVFVREEANVQQAPAAVSDDVRQAATAAATTAAGGSPAAGTAGNAAAGESTFAGKVYRLVEGQSEAWYLAPEKLANLPTSSTAKGTTKSVSGEFHLTANGLDGGKATTFTVGLRDLKSDSPRRDERVQGSLRTSQYPTATFKATRVTGVPAEFTSAETVLQMTGMLELNGQTKEVTWELKVKKDGEILSVLGTTKFRYDYFGITKPDIAGFVSVEDEVTLQVQVFAAPAGAAAGAGTTAPNATSTPASGGAGY
jgi:polyisoprenoid-binding protein YceI